MKNTLLLSLILILFYACEKTADGITPNQQRIISTYNDVSKNYLEESDSINFVLKKIESISKTEPDRYKAIVSICGGHISFKYSAYEIATKKFTKAIKLLSNSNTDTLVARAQCH